MDFVLNTPHLTIDFGLTTPYSSIDCDLTPILLRGAILTIDVMHLGNLGLFETEI